MTTTGVVKKLVRDKGFGFVRGDDGVERFFHRSAADDFDSYAEGDKVRFEDEPSPKGPRARVVERA